MVPLDGYPRPPMPGPMPPPRPPSERPFIPPGLTGSPASTGEPRPVLAQTHPSTMGANVIHIPESPPSSMSDSTRRSHSPPGRRVGRSSTGSPRRGERESSRRRSDRGRSPSRRPRRHRDSSIRYSRSSSGDRDQSPVRLQITNPSLGMLPGPGMVPDVVQDHMRIPQHPSTYHPPPSPYPLQPLQPSVQIIPPSAGSSSSGRQPQQPTIIIQQPPQQPQQPIIMQPPPSPGVPMGDGMYPPMAVPVSEMGPPMLGTPMSGMPGVPMTGMPGVPMTGMPGVPMTGMPGVPLTGIPGVPITEGVPVAGGYYPPPMTGVPMSGMPPMILQQPSRSSSRSSRRHRRSRTPPPPAPPQVVPTAPIVIAGTRRSRSRSRSRSPHRRTPPFQPGAPVTILPPGVGMPLGPQPGMVMMPGRSRSSSRHSPRRRTPPVIVQQPTPIAAPTIYPAPMTQAPSQPPQVIVPGMPMPGVGMGPVVYPRSRSSRSHSPRRGDGPIIIPPTGIPYRRSRSPRYRSRSPRHYRSRSRSPRPRRRSRSRSPRPHHRSRSRSPRPHRRSRSRSRSPRPHRRSRTRSRTPPRSYLPTVPIPTTILPGQPAMMPPMLPPGAYPTYRRSRDSHSPRRSRSPQRVQVLGGPRRRGYSPRDYSPRGYPGRRSPPYLRTQSPSYERDHRHHPRAYDDRDHRRLYSPIRRGRTISRSPPFYPGRTRGAYPPSRRYYSPRDRSYSPPLRHPTRPPRPRGRRSLTLSPTPTRGYSMSPRRRGPRGVPTSRDYSPDIRGGRRPRSSIHRTRSESPSSYRTPVHVITRSHRASSPRSPIRRASSRAQSMSPIPRITIEPTHSVLGVPGSEDAGSPDTVRVTVPARRGDPHRPPTIVDYASRTGTPRRPSGSLNIFPFLLVLIML